MQREALATRHGTKRRVLHRPGLPADRGQHEHGLLCRPDVSQRRRWGRFSRRIWTGVSRRTPPTSFTSRSLPPATSWPGCSRPTRRAARSCSRKYSFIPARPSTTRNSRATSRLAPRVCPSSESVSGAMTSGHGSFGREACRSYAGHSGDLTIEPAICAEQDSNRGLRTITVGKSRSAADRHPARRSANRAGGQRHPRSHEAQLQRLPTR